MLSACKRLRLSTITKPITIASNQAVSIPRTPPPRLQGRPAPRAADTRGQRRARRPGSSARGRLREPRRPLRRAAPGPAEAAAAAGEGRGARCGGARRAGRGVRPVLAAGAGRAGGTDRRLGGRRDVQPLLLVRCLLSCAGCPSPVAVPEPKGGPYVTVNPRLALSQVPECVVGL